MHLVNFDRQAYGIGSKKSLVHTNKIYCPPVAKVLVATTAMLTFISFWRAAAIVLNDLASSAYYAGVRPSSFIGKTARGSFSRPCSSPTPFPSYTWKLQHVRPRRCLSVVKEAMGGTLAKFSVSALMFDYVLTGPISGVSAGRYLAGLLNEVFALLI